ncbi:MAG TPA: hypothetical protein VFR89_03510 [candidate division Zixibacteria bacterium]|nr:hypothetical protein [candidate division Zixibacteria bacterium]
MRNTRLFLFVLLVLAVASSASMGHVRKGINELSLRGSIDVVSANGNSNTSTEIGLGLGHSFTDNLQPGVNFSLVKLENVDAFGTLGGFVNYYFLTAPEARTVPYLGGTVGMGYGSGDDPFIWGGYGGVKIFVVNNADGGGGALSLEPFYQRLNFEAGGIDNFGLRTGISVLF